MKQTRTSTLAFRALALMVPAAALLGCGEHETMASKSAREFREAQRRGESFAGEGHGHGQDATPAADPRDQERSAMTGKDSGEHGMEHGHADGTAGTTEHGTSETGDHGHGPATEHGRHGAPAPSKAGMQGHARTGTPQHSMSGPHDHRQPAPTAATPEMHPHGAGRETPPPPLVNAVSAAAGAPAAALAPDPIDAPAATAVAEARRAAATGSAMGGTRGMHAHGASGYRQRDAGREPAAQAPLRPHEDHSAPPPGAAWLPEGGSRP